MEERLSVEDLQFLQSALRSAKLGDMRSVAMPTAMLEKVMGYLDVLESASDSGHGLAGGGVKIRSSIGPASQANGNGRKP